MAHRGGKRLEYASCSEMERIDLLLAKTPPKISMIDGATARKVGPAIQEKNMRLHKIRSDESIKYVYGSKRIDCKYYLISGDKHFDVIDRQVDQLTNYQVEVCWKKQISDGKKV